MFLTDIKVGEQINIEVDRGGDTYFLNTKVYDIINNGIVVFPLALYNKPFHLNQRDILNVIIKEESNLRKWDCEQWRNNIANGLPLIELISTKKGSIYNRRDAFRVNLNIETIARKINIDSEKDNENEFEVIVKDLSLNGVGFKAKEELYSTDVVSLSITGGSLKYDLIAEVTRKEEITEGKYKFFYGLTITESTKELSRFIVEKQREDIAKRKILK